ncbi:MAG: hypothetical protein HZB16_03770 [Armatimonadetes bacterium]|nr:hypothetical protein [Armatimonadota bacterium]
MEFANPFALIILTALSALVLAFILTSTGGRELFIRRVPGVDAIDEVVGRAVELGRPILFSVGLGGIDITTLQAITVIGHVAKIAARFRNRVIVPVVDPMAIPVIEEVQRESYASERAEEAFNPEDIRFLSGEQFAYAAGVVGIMHRERVGATFFFGNFAAEALVMAESGQQVGAVQIASTPDSNQIPFFLATCDYVIIGEEYYAVTALMSRDPVLRGSLIGQDYVKVILLLLIVLGFTLTTIMGPGHFLAKWFAGSGG